LFPKAEAPSAGLVQRLICQSQLIRSIDRCQERISVRAREK